MYDSPTGPGLGTVQEAQKREKEVPAQLQRIARLLTEHSQTIDALEKDLSPVLGPTKPNAKEPIATATPGSLAGALAGIANQIDRQTDWLRELRGRLEI